MAVISKKGDGVKYLFVYGTLRKRRALSCFLIWGFNFVGEAILPNAELYKYNYLPVLVSGKGKVFGEVYKIQNPSHFLILDKLESNYNRIISDIKFKDKIIRVFVYFYKYPDLVKNNSNFLKINSGDWNHK